MGDLNQIRREGGDFPGGLGGLQEDEQTETGGLKAMPREAPDDGECRRIWDHCGTPEPVRRHCEAVRAQAEAMGKRLLEAGKKVDLNLIRSGALLHDVARTEENHPQRGAAILLAQGYPKVAEVIRCHHDLEPWEDFEKGFPDLWLEAAVVYLADKQVLGDKAVTLEQRFADSRKKCQRARDREGALAAHERRYLQAKRIETLIFIETDGGQ